MAEKGYPNSSSTKKRLGELLRPSTEAMFMYHTTRSKAERIGRRLKDGGRDILTHGTYKSYDNTIYLSGACKVGKSTLASQFIGQKIPQEWKSTDGLMIHFGQNGIDLEWHDMVPLKKDNEKFSVMSKILRGDAKVKKETSTDKRESNQPENLNKNRRSSTYTSTKHTPEQQIYSLTDEILSAIYRGQYNIDIAPSDIVDFGGQRSFDMTHQLFIRRKGSFIVMFDGRYGFTELLPEYPGLNITNEEIIKHWVNSILTFTVDEDDLMPMILFAATHSDYFNKEDFKVKKEEFLNILRDYFGDHPMRSRIVLDEIYFINGRNPEDKEIQLLKERLVKIATSQPSWGKLKPVRWVPLELQMEAMKKGRRYIVKKEELTRANELNGDLALTKDQLEHFLEYQHANGKIIYINQAGLSKFVVLYPPAAVNILRSFITDKMFWPEGHISCVLEQIYSSGTVSKQQLNAIWDQKWVPVKSAEESDFVIRLLVHLDVLIIPRQHRGSDVFKPGKEEMFLVPCIITEKLPMDFLEEDNFCKRSLALSFTIKRTCIPPSLSFKLIGAVASIWSLKVKDTKTLLFQFAAVLNIDEKNEIRLFVQDNMIIIYLTNKGNKTWISPDMAASIQECLVNTLDYTLAFYFSSMKSGNSTFDVKDLYDIKIGEICNKKPCVIPVDEARAKKEWTCTHGNTHQSGVSLKWIFDRSILTCPPECKGLEPDILDEIIADKYNIRLAERINVESFKEMMIHMGIRSDTLRELEYQYRENLLVFKFMCMKKLKNEKVGVYHDPCFKDIQKALSDIGDNRHHLCQIRRNTSQLDRVANIDLQVEPDDTLLYELAYNKMGNCIVPLAMELGLTIAAVDETMYRYPRDMYQQIYDILKKWKGTKTIKPTIFQLMLAVERVDKGGLCFLLEKFNVKLK